MRNECPSISCSGCGVFGESFAFSLPLCLEFGQRWVFARCMQTLGTFEKADPETYSRKKEGIGHVFRVQRACSCVTLKILWTIHFPQTLTENTFPSKFGQIVFFSVCFPFPIFALWLRPTDPKYFLSLPTSSPLPLPPFCEKGERRIELTIHSSPFFPSAFCKKV